MVIGRKSAFGISVIILILCAKSWSKITSNTLLKKYGTPFVRTTVIAQHLTLFSLEVFANYKL